MPTFYEKLCAYDESKEVKKEIDRVCEQPSWERDRDYLRYLEKKLQELIEIVG